MEKPTIKYNIFNIYRANSISDFSSKKKIQLSVVY